MTSTGLARRRVQGHTSTTTSDEGSSHANGTSSTSPGGTTTSHAGSAFEGGSKIAFDPRDLEWENENERQGGKLPRLTLLEEVLLLGIKDKQVSFTSLSIYAVIVLESPPLLFSYDLKKFCRDTCHSGTTIYRTLSAVAY
jgi:hypothetical protein